MRGIVLAQISRLGLDLPETHYLVLVSRQAALSDASPKREA
jgi:hypothetical protein